MIKSNGFSQLCQLNLLVENDYHFYSKKQFIFEYLEKLAIENNTLT
jgi:hypothetical protein